MTGMRGVGIGEVVIPQLVKKNGVPLPVAAGTSVLVVFLNAVGETVVSCIIVKLAFSCGGRKENRHYVLGAVLDEVLDLNVGRVLTMGRAICRIAYVWVCFVSPTTKPLLHRPCILLD